MRGRRANPDWESRFWAKVDKSAGPAGCWIWTAGKDGAGYGIFQLASRARKAHRVSFSIKHGREPTAAILHGCNNTSCCNPLHLREGTAAENARDRITHGTHTSGERHHSSFLTIKAADEIRRLYSAGESVGSIRSRFGVSPTHFRRIVRGDVWGPNPYPAPDKTRPMVGRVFERLVVVQEVGRNSNGERLFSCSCACGGTHPRASEYCLKAGKTMSCGCLRKERCRAQAHAASMASWIRPLHHFDITEDEQ